MKNKKISVLLFLALSCLFLFGCDESKSDAQLAKENKMLENVFEFKGYIKVKESAESTGNRKKIYEDKSTGCLYLLDSEDGYMPLYNEYGEVDGCNKSSNTSLDKKDSYLKLMSEYYPNKDSSELEYLLESVYDYNNKSLEELSDLLKLMTKESEDK